MTDKTVPFEEIENTLVDDGTITIQADGTYQFSNGTWKILKKGDRINPSSLSATTNYICPICGDVAHGKHECEKAK